MNVVEETYTQDSGGGQIATTDTAYEEVPVTYEPLRNERQRFRAGDQLTSVSEYLLTFPTHHQGERINIDPKKHRLKVLERGNEPEKTFRIISVRDQSGVVFEAIADIES